MAALLDSLAGIRVTGQAASAAEAGPLLASGIATSTSCSWTSTSGTARAST